METIAIKQAMRKEFLRLRSTLDQPLLSRAAQGHILHSPKWQQAKTIALYLPVRGELDTSILLHRANQEGKQVYLPRCCENGQLEFALWQGKEHLQSGSFKILEPALHCPLLPEEQGPDLAVVPALAYDLAGYRLGYGGGYYDRLLAKESFSETCLLGLVPACCIVEKLPREDWDKAVHGLVSEDKIIWI